MNIPCIKCKGATPLQSCGRTFCPIIAKAEAIYKIKDKLKKEDFFGSSPLPFVGRHGYPKVNVGILSPPEQTEQAWLYDAPRYWSQKNFQIPEIVDLRSALINSRFRTEIKAFNRFLPIAQEIGMASKPVDVEIKLKQKPRFKLQTDAYLGPMGPNATLKKAAITENPKISYKVEKVVYDYDLKANDASIYLYEQGFDENFLTKILSIGNLGLKYQRKLVPTRWSISASHSIIANHLIKKIKQYNEMNYTAYFGSYLGNYYLILFFPEIYSYELFESYMPHASWNIGDGIDYTTDYEPYEGRKTYAENCGGGFYSVRMVIAEKLAKLKKQASVLALRFITGEYAVHLGVWVTTEATRKALSSKPIEFSNKELMLKYAKSLIKKKFNYNLDSLLKESKLLRNIKQQSKLIKFI